MGPKVKHSLAGSGNWTLVRSCGLAMRAGGLRREAATSVGEDYNGRFAVPPQKPVGVLEATIHDLAELQNC